MKTFQNLFYTITYVFILSGLIDLGITLYIIFYKNNPVIEVAANVCYHCVTKGLSLVGALHVLFNVPFITPNPVSNSYHIYTPLGRGYGAWSSGQLLQIDYIKTNLGSEFNYKEVVDSNNMLHPNKILSYAEKHNLKLGKLNKIGDSVLAVRPKNN